MESLLRKDNKPDWWHEGMSESCICPHNNFFPRCPEEECIEEMYRSEEAATCPHGFLVGCPICIANLNQKKSST